MDLDTSEVEDYLAYCAMMRREAKRFSERMQDAVADVLTAVNVMGGDVRMQAATMAEALRGMAGRLDHLAEHGTVD